MAHVLTLRIERSPKTGLFFITSEDCPRLMVTGQSFSEAIERIAPVVKSLIEAGAVIPSLDELDLS